MVKNAVISVKGIQYIDGEKIETELVTEGDFTYGDEEIQINYAEYDQETGLKTFSHVEVCDNHVVLTREGAQNTRMEFKKDVKCVGYYELPFGSFNISTMVSKMENNLTVFGGTLAINYHLSLDRLTTTENDILISVKLS